MAKTKQEGYYKIESKDQWLHFSMNCWINLKEERNLNFNEVMLNLGEKDQIEQISILADLIYSAALAYNQEEGIEEEVNIYEIRNWLPSMTQEETQGIMEAMMSSVNIGDKGKKKAKK